jgi:dethiobiotin synthetase
MTSFRGGYIIVGNDTEVGKTTIACQLIEGLRRRGIYVGAFKPAASGYRDDDPSSDMQRLREACGKDFDIDQICPYRFTEAVAPLLAAQRTGIGINDERIDQCLLEWKLRCNFLFVETAGGLMSPLTEHRTNLQFAQNANLPAIVVIGNRLGAINQANLTCHALLSHSIRISFVVFNEVEPSSAPELLASNVEIFMRTYSQSFQNALPPIIQLDHAKAISESLFDWIMMDAANL